MDQKDAKKFKTAVDFWFLHKGWDYSIEAFPEERDGWKSYYVKLLRKYKERDYS